MKKLVIAALAGAAALGLASCGGSSSNCTPEALKQKGTDLMAAMQEAMKDPAKASANAATWQQKVNELMTKAQAAGDKPTDDVCKAYDELIKTIKG
jgi:ABC-type glycerol-3-phosphate transport system substrate-binding protein